jgi:hypothetical protein
MERRGYTVLALCTAFMIAIPSAFAGPVHLVNGQYFAKARAKLLRAGWHPVVSHLKFTDGTEQRLAGDAGAMTGAGWVEVEYCSGAVRNYCFF